MNTKKANPLRARLEAALAKPIPEGSGERWQTENSFNPWEDVIEGIYGDYAGECDRLMIAALEAVRDEETFEFMEKEGFAAEFMLYVLAGHGLTEYGTSPRGGWPDPSVRDLWQPLIDKWRAFATVRWEGEV